MSYWVIRDLDGEYLSEPVANGYACSGDRCKAEWFSSKEEAESRLVDYIVEGKCYYEDKSYYSFEFVQEHIDTSLEARVVALEALYSRSAPSPAAPPQSALEEATVSFTLLELQESMAWYSGEEDAKFPANESNGDLWVLWERAYWQGFEYAKERFTQSIEELKSGE